MKKSLSILLCIIFVLSLFTGCGNGESKLVGKWETTVNIPTEALDAVKNALGEEVSGFAEYIKLENLNVKIVATFNEDGAYTSEITKESLIALRDSVAKQVSDGFNAFTKELNVDEIDILQFSEDSIKSILNDEMIQKVYDSAMQSGYYKLENGKLFTAENAEAFDESKYEKVEVSDSELKITETVGMDEDIISAMKSVYPLTYKKVK